MIVWERACPTSLHPVVPGSSRSISACHSVLLSWRLFFESSVSASGDFCDDASANIDIGLVELDNNFLTGLVSR